MALTHFELEVCRYLKKAGRASMSELKQMAAADINQHPAIYAATKRMVSQGFVMEDTSERAFKYRLNPSTETNFDQLEAL